MTTHLDIINTATTNSRITQGLTVASNAVHLLGLQGYTVRNVDIGNRAKPCIEIDAPSERRWIRGAVRRRETRGNTRRSIVAAQFHGCQVEWEVVEYSGVTPS